MSEHVDVGTESFWVQTRSGRAVDLLDTKPEQIFAQDIAVQLGRIPRWNGATVGRADEIYPVAMHSVLVAQLLPADSPPMLKLVALLHDAAEAYTGDMPSPMKWAIRHLTGADPVKIISTHIQDAIHIAAGFPGLMSPTSEWHDIIKTADMLALALEDRYLMAPHPRLWIPLPDVNRVALQPMTCTPKVASLSFMFSLQRYVRAAGVLPMPEFGL